MPALSPQEKILAIIKSLLGDSLNEDIQIIKVDNTYRTTPDLEITFTHKWLVNYIKERDHIPLSPFSLSIQNVVGNCSVADQLEVGVQNLTTTKNKHLYTMIINPSEALRNLKSDSKFEPSLTEITKLAATVKIKHAESKEASDKSTSENASSICSLSSPQTKMLTLIENLLKDSIEDKTIKIETIKTADRKFKDVRITFTPKWLESNYIKFGSEKTLKSEVFYNLSSHCKISDLLKIGIQSQQVNKAKHTEEKHNYILVINPWTALETPSNDQTLKDSLEKIIMLAKAFEVENDEQAYTNITSLDPEPKPLDNANKQETEMPQWSDFNDSFFKSDLVSLDKIENEAKKIAIEIMTILESKRNSLEASEQYVLFLNECSVDIQEMHLNTLTKYGIYKVEDVLHGYALFVDYQTLSTEVDKDLHDAIQGLAPPEESEQSKSAEPEKKKQRI